MSASVRACVRTCVRARVRARVRSYVCHAYGYVYVRASYVRARVHACARTYVPWCVPWFVRSCARAYVSVCVCLSRVRCVHVCMCPSLYVYD